MQYWLYMERRIKLDDKQAELELQTWSIAGYERWKQCWDTNVAGDYGQAFDGEREIPITDPSELDDWFNNIAGAHGMTGADAERAIRQGSPLLGWAEGEGVKV